MNIIIEYKLIDGNLLKMMKVVGDGDEIQNTRAMETLLHINWNPKELSPTKKEILYINTVKDFGIKKDIDEPIQSFKGSIMPTGIVPTMIMPQEK